MKCQLKSCKNRSQAYFRSVEVCKECFVKLKWGDIKSVKELESKIRGRK